MKIVVIGPVFPYRGGIAHYTTLLAQNLTHAGHNVTVFSFQEQYPSFLYPGQTDRDTSQLPLKVDAVYSLHPFLPWTWLQTARQIANDVPDLVLVHWWTTFWAVPFAFIMHWLRKQRIRTAYLIHNVMPHEARFWDRFLAHMALSTTERIIVQTEKEAERLSELLPDITSLIVPHPIYRMFLDQVVTRQQARLQLSLPENVPVILSFGIVRPYKGLKYLLRAVAALKQAGLVLRLLIAGEFWEPESEYHALAQELEIEDCVHIVNRYIPNEEVPLFFHAADVFAAPYVDGTQSGALKMALGFGLPVVLTPCILDESLSGRKNVWLAKEGDVGSLAQSIREALSQGEIISDADLPDGWDRIVQAVESLARR